MPEYLCAAELIDLARRAETASPAACACTKTSLVGWQSQPVSLDEAQLREIATLLPPDDPEPSFAEYLPGKVKYWSPDAPIAPRYFPYNRCGIWECRHCGRLYLRYTEGGGYFVDRRIRALDSALIEDVPIQD
ncbi:eL43 family ribosomal protein [Chitinasiproducens palmae]|uniref:Uncharacterized protein n=1 Tax=Chitinasiproducens palmae TaxID=1770053 RepID=A0A1H2PLT5_9BURK|nr:hypothetical protein [Chitinasiproducens palmae]SDV46998.1 hypothetical protein SAMN05216551_102175 [Chitinasiproducens palmae]